MRMFVLLLLLMPVSVMADAMSAANTNTATTGKAGLITVHGEAVAKVAPDRVTLPVTIHEDNLNLKTAKDKHDKKLADLLKLAADTGIAKENIQTSYTSINPQYDYREHGKPKLLGYQVETSIDFKLDDMSKLADFMNKVIELGITQLGDVSYSIKDDENLKKDVLVKALAQAYDKASRLAAEAKVAIDKPVEIDEGVVAENPYSRPMRFMAANAAMGMAAARPAPELPEGLIEVRQNVTVTYQLK